MLTPALTPRTVDASILRAAFEDAAPFRHVVIDDFFEESDALALHRAFPTFSPSQRAKARLFAGRVYGPPKFRAPAIDAALAGVAQRSFATLLSQISGIAALAMDETNAGAGAHVGLPGSALPIHADHNTHPHASWLYRRLNLLVYLNPNWTRAWRTNLLLYDATGSHRVAEIETRFNRAVLMEVSDTAFHGYHALDIPSGESRQVLASYYYSPEPGLMQAREPHGTLFGRPADLSLRERAGYRLRHALVKRFGTLLPQPSWTQS